MVDNQNELYSVKIRAGSRTYFLNVKEDKKGNLYLVIKESKLLAEGGSEAHRIMIFEDDFQKFVSGMKDALEFIKTTQKKVRGESDSSENQNYPANEEKNEANISNPGEVAITSDITSDIQDLLD